MTHARSDYFMVAVTAWQPNMAPQLRISALEEGIWPAGRMNVPVCSTGTCDMHAYSLLNFTGTSTGRDEPPLRSLILTLRGPYRYSYRCKYIPRILGIKGALHVLNTSGCNLVYHHEVVELRRVSCTRLFPSCALCLIAAGMK